MMSVSQMRVHYKLPILLVLLTWLVSGCQAFRPFSRWFPPRSVSVPVQVTRNVPARPPPTPTATCTALPPGMGVTVTLRSGALVVEVTGLQPAERPVFIYDRGVNGGRFEVLPGQGVGPDGRAVDQTLQVPDSTAVSGQTWEVQVVHVRGAACVQFTLP
jgi:hypothetical protein